MNDSEKNKPEEEKLNSTIDHFQNDKKKKSNVIKIKFESHEIGRASCRERVC